jgi:hypothetical protein
MARPLRIEYPGAYYHIMNRGLSRRDIFLEDRGRQRFLPQERIQCGVTPVFEEHNLQWRVLGRFTIDGHLVFSERHSQSLDRPNSMLLKITLPS